MATIFEELTDLTGRVEILTTRPAFDGTYSNVYRGEYDGQTKILRERGIWGAFNHPNILPLIGYAEGDERFEPFGALVSPWCINGDAAKFLEERGPSLSLAQRIALWEGVVKGVDYLHNFDPIVVHGDLKPANILLDGSGNPLICDFGLARLILEEGGSGTTTTTAHTGTERYLAYELVVSDDIITPTVASDIHALGCIGLDFIFLQRPYSHRKNNAHGHIYFDIRQGVPPAPHPESLRRPATGAILSALHTATSRPAASFAWQPQAIRLQEEADAEMARRWESESQIAASSRNAVEAHGGASATPENLDIDPPEYDDYVYQGQQSQHQHPPNHSIGDSGPGLTHRNHSLLPQQETETGPSSHLIVPTRRPLPRKGKPVRPSSWGGGNPNRLSTAPNDSTHFYVTNSTSMSSFPPPANIGNARPPPNQTGMSQPSSSSVNSSPGARSLSQPLASTSFSTPPPLSTVTPPGISFPNSDSFSGILHGYGRPISGDQPLPTATPLQEVVKMEPEPSPPFFIVAQTWKDLIKFIASQSNTRVEPSASALAREKQGPPNLRVVLHFIRLSNGGDRIIMYLAVQSIVPPPEDYPVTDTSVVPYLFPAPEPGRPLESLPESRIYSIPTKPLPQLPISLPNLAPYLQAALDESSRSRDSRSRLQKLVQETTVTTPYTTRIAAALIGGSAGPRYESEGNPIKVAESSGSRRSFLARVFRPKSSGDADNKSVNNKIYDIITPFTLDNYA
ncbi:hypothetical protein FRC17_000935 [Serendipita sp. 399]|nr:hypothetical protein FRC17_000935 [Serendipita sp. 399]